MMVGCGRALKRAGLPSEEMSSPDGITPTLSITNAVSKLLASLLSSAVTGNSFSRLSGTYVDRAFCRDLVGSEVSMTDLRSAGGIPPSVGNVLRFDGDSLAR